MNKPNQIQTPASNPKKPINWIIPVLLVISIFCLITAGYFLFQNQQLKQKLQQSSLYLPSTPTATTVSSPSSTSIKTETDNPEKIDWLTYTDPKAPNLSFQYPKGGTITIKKDEPEGNYVLEVNYKDLNLKINSVLGGIGGRQYPPESFYTIIYGNNYQGIAKEVFEDKTKNQVKITYFQLLPGGVEFGHFLTGKSMFEFTIPFTSRSKYEKIADIIACSTHKVKPENQGLFAKAYHDHDTTSNSIIGVNFNLSTYVILSNNPDTEEMVDGFVINPTGEYLVIDTYQKNQTFARVYDLNKKKFLSLNGSQKLIKGGLGVEWKSDYIFTLFDMHGKNVEYNIKKLVNTIN